MKNSLHLSKLLNYIKSYQICKVDGGLSSYKQPHEINGYIMNNDLADGFAEKKDYLSFLSRMRRTTDRSSNEAQF